MCLPNYCSPREPLGARHDSLAARRDEMMPQVAVIIDGRSSVDEGSAAASACATAMAELEQVISSYSADVRRFDRRSGSPPRGRAETGTGAAGGAELTHRSSSQSPRHGLLAHQRRRQVRIVAAGRCTAGRAS